MFETVLDILTWVCLLGAAVLSVCAGIGLLRFRDPLTRLHAATKPQTLGLLLVIAALALSQRSFLTLFALIPVFVFQSLTAPVAAHMAGRAAYRAGHVDRDSLAVDELEPVLKKVRIDTEQPGRRLNISAEEFSGVSREKR